MVSFVKQKLSDLAFLKTLPLDLYLNDFQGPVLGQFPDGHFLHGRFSDRFFPESQFPEDITLTDSSRMRSSPMGSFPNGPLPQWKIPRNTFFFYLFKSSFIVGVEK